jgi:tripartite-type tricarboxylate transporter receptor subunit TctC
MRQAGPMNRFPMLLALAAILASGMAISQPAAYPQKPVRVLVGLVPGGNPDVLARMVAAKLSESLGQQFIVENRPGMSSGIAADVVAKAPADGHAIFIGDSGVVTTNPHLYKSLPYDPFRDLAPVSLAVVVPMWLVVHPSVPARSVKELVALAKSHKEPMLYASSGNGSIHHITMEAFKSATRVDMTHVPYRGAGQSVPAMLSGEVMVAFLGYPAMSGAIKSGRLRALGFSMARRSSLTPEIPTVAETVAPGFDMAAPLGVFVAAGTRREIVTRLSQSVNEAVRKPDVLARMAAIGMEPVGLTPEQYEKNLREEHERLGALIKRIGMRLD